MPALSPCIAGARHRSLLLAGPSQAAWAEIKAVQAEITSIVAAAVHQDWISVQEGVCDTLDCDAFLAEDQRAKYQQVTSERLWSA